MDNLIKLGQLMRLPRAGEPPVTFDLPIGFETVYIQILNKEMDDPTQYLTTSPYIWFPYYGIDRVLIGGFERNYAFIDFTLGHTLPSKLDGKYVVTMSCSMKHLRSTKETFMAKLKRIFKCS